MTSALEPSRGDVFPQRFIELHLEGLEHGIQRLGIQLGQLTAIEPGEFHLLHEIESIAGVAEGRASRLAGMERDLPPHR